MNARKAIKVNDPQASIIAVDSTRKDANRKTIQPFDKLFVESGELIPDNPLTGEFYVFPNGNLVFPEIYEASQVQGLQVSGLIVEEAEKKILKKLREDGFRNPQLQITRHEPADQNKVRQARKEIVQPNDEFFLISPNIIGKYSSSSPKMGNYYVDSSGSLPLGLKFGRVNVGGLSVEDAEEKIKDHLILLDFNPTEMILKHAAAKQLSATASYPLPIAPAAPQTSEKRFKFNVRICEGDPNGSVEKGTIKFLMSPSITAPAGVAAYFSTAEQVEIWQKQLKDHSNSISDKDGKVITAEAKPAENGKITLLVKFANTQIGNRRLSQIDFDTSAKTSLLVTELGKTNKFILEDSSPTDRKLWLEIVVTEATPFLNAHTNKAEIDYLNKMTELAKQQWQKAAQAFKEKNSSVGEGELKTWDLQYKRLQAELELAKLHQILQTR